VKGTCDPYTQTQLTEIAIKWSERPDDCPEFFKARDIELEWLYDWEEEGWSVYAAEDVETANAIMEDINEILKGKGTYRRQCLLGMLHKLHCIGNAYWECFKNCFKNCNFYSQSLLAANFLAAILQSRCWKLWQQQGGVHSASIAGV
jgi:hypothetical protein